ncbi:MAG: VVA0879 family protein [Pseudomonadota bacterium]
MRERISLAEAHRRMQAQGVSAQRHFAFACPICGTVQSMASLVAAGCPSAEVQGAIGFSCEGRFSGAGPWPSSKDRSAKAAQRRQVRGCDWTLGGLFRLHALEIEWPEDRAPAAADPRPCFEIVDAAKAQALAALFTSAPAHPS